MILAAPNGNPLTRWAQSHEWIATTFPNDANALCGLIAQLMQESTWSEMAAQTRRAAETDFDPEQLQERFEAALISVIRRAVIGPAA